MGLELAWLGPTRVTSHRCDVTVGKRKAEAHLGTGRSRSSANRYEKLAKRSEVQFVRDVTYWPSSFGFFSTQPWDSRCASAICSGVMCWRIPS